MKNLEQIWKNNGSLYKTTLTGSSLFQKKDIKEWLQQKQEQMKREFEERFNLTQMSLIKELLEELEQ